MKHYRCSYAYDTPCYRDFIVEAKNKKEAEAKIKKALAEGKFVDVVGNPDGAQSNERVFVMDEADADDVESKESLKELTEGEEK